MGNYTADLHQPQNSTGDYHIHLSEKGNQILAINKNGSAHDGCNGVRIPNKAFKALQIKYPDWNWPKNQIIESYSDVIFVNPADLKGLRVVKVVKHQNFDLQTIDSYMGFFHCFADDPFLTGGNNYFSRAVALVENAEGYVSKVPPTKIQFL